MGATAPQKDCTDGKCPFHGEILVKRELLRGKVIKKDVSRSATIEWSRPFFVPKYERYEVRRYRLRTHNPSCISATIGDEVLVAKTRPLSKTKHHVILQVLSAAQKNKITEKSTITVSKKKTAKNLLAGNPQDVNQKDVDHKKAMGQGDDQ